MKKHWRLFLLLAAFVACVVFVVLVIDKFLWPRHGISVENSGRVRGGMSPADVRNVLGAKPDRDVTSDFCVVMQLLRPKEYQPRAWAWGCEDGRELWVAFGGEGTVVTTVLTGSPRPGLLERWRRWLLGR